MSCAATLSLLVFGWLLPRPAAAQAIEDAALLPRRGLTTGVAFGQDRWVEYWEGSLKRENENIGTLTTQVVSWHVAYGVSDRLTVLGLLPYVWTRASEGTLKEMHGMQDLTIAAKYRLLSAPFTDHGAVTALVVASAGLPVGDYSPDFLPLSIGLGSRRVAGRFTLGFEAHDGWFLAGSAAHTWRGNVKLDRPAYYTDGRLYSTDEVAMPRVFDYTVAGGYRRGRVRVPLALTEQRTLGGGDIRRQDMPFVSNRMNFVRVDGGVGYELPASGLMLRLGAGRVLSGRNVGQATGISAGVAFTRHF